MFRGGLLASSGRAMGDTVVGTRDVILPNARDVLLLLHVVDVAV
jgi:hypothetical protein